jgi:hypothetical protein
MSIIVARAVVHFKTMTEHIIQVDPGTVVRGSEPSLHSTEEFMRCYLPPSLYGA